MCRQHILIWLKVVNGIMYVILTWLKWIKGDTHVVWIMVIWLIYVTWGTHVLYLLPHVTWLIVTCDLN